MHVVLFEGSRWVDLAPFSLTRPVFMLTVGAGTLLEKQLRHLRPTRLTLWVRPELARWCEVFVAPRVGVPCAVNAPLDDEPALLMSGRTLHLQQYEYASEPSVVVDEHPRGDVVRAAVVQIPGLSLEDAMTRSARWTGILDLPQALSQSRMCEHVWDPIGWNEEALLSDFVARQGCGEPVQTDKAYHVVEPRDVCCAADARIGPGAVLDASKGPILIDEDASIGANAVLQGPCWVGRHSQIMPLALIRPGTSIGPMCKVGGEVSNSIFAGHANKSHEGFVGDSSVGEWVNLGAGTTTSNLKNTYGEIGLPVRAGEEVRTGRRFLGAVIGDHAKTAVGTRLMTGSYVGAASMVATGGLPPRHVPSFTWLTDAGPQAYRMDKALEVMRAVYARRNRPWTDVDEQTAAYAASVAPRVEGATVTVA